MKPFLPLFLVLALLFGSSGCNKRTTLRRLKGNWELRTFALDGVNQIGGAFQTARLEFDKKSEGERAFRLQGVFLDGSPYEEAGTYHYIDPEQVRLEFATASWGNLTGDMALEPDDLRIRGFSDDSTFFLIEGNQ